MPNTREKTTREMTFEEEAVFYEKEASAEFAKETGNCDCGGVNNILRRGMRIISKARREVANGVTVQKWISVTERLPEHGDIVLCHTKHDDLLVFQWCEMSHRWVDQYEDYRQDYITHWMPLPEPPKGE